MRDLVTRAVDNTLKECEPGLDINDLNSQTDLIVDLNFDSLSFLQLIIKLEESLNIIIPDELLIIDNLKNYKILVDTVFSIVNESGGNNNG